MLGGGVVEIVFTSKPQVCRFCLNLRTGRPPTEVQSPQPPTSAWESAQGGAGQKPGARGSARESARPPCSLKGQCSSSLFLEDTQGANTFPSTSPSTPFLAGTSPSTLPNTFGVLGFCASVGGRPSSQLQTWTRQKSSYSPAGNFYLRIFLFELILGELTGTDTDLQLFQIFFLSPIPISVPLQGSVPQNLPICNCSELITESLPISTPICNSFELIR